MDKKEIDYIDNGDDHPTIIKLYAALGYAHIENMLPCHAWCHLFGAMPTSLIEYVLERLWLGDNNG